MLAPPAPGKRPEKLRFNFSLLFTDDGVEYCIQEARARSMGLLGKKWGPPPASEFGGAGPSSLSVPVDFNDDGQRSTRLTAVGGRRKSVMGGAEPTVTINTKEALADVFGMYNSPEKTSRLAALGSKHAPLKRVEPVTPVVARGSALNPEDENPIQSSKTPTSGMLNNYSSQNVASRPLFSSPTVCRRERTAKSHNTWPRKGTLGPIHIDRPAKHYLVL